MIWGQVPSRAICALLLVVYATHVAAQTSTPDSTRVRRLVELGRLWGEVKYFHPRLPSPAVNWDSAVVVAIPKVRQANSTEEYAAALSEMLDALGDPMTRLVSAAPADTARPRGRSVATRWTSDSTLIISVPSFRAWTVQWELQATAPAVRAAPRVVFDLRGPAPPTAAYGYTSHAFDEAGLSELLTLRGIAVPSLERRMYSGFPSQTESGSRGYWSGAYEVAQGVITPAPGNLDHSVAFVVDAVTDIPRAVWAMQRAGAASVVLDDTHGGTPLTGDWRDEPLGEGLRARVRVADLVSEAGEPVTPDTVVRRDATSDDAPLRAALLMVREMRARNGTIGKQEAAPARPDEPYANMHYPTLPYRILAAYRWWNAIRYFYPYKALIGEDWDAVLAQSIVSLEHADDSTEYALALAEMATRIHDSHGYLRSTALDAYFGTELAGVLGRYIEGKLVIVALSPDSITQASGIAVGDVVLSVNGEDAAARRARLARYLPHSTPQALDDLVARKILRGPSGSVLELVVSGADNRRREVTLLCRPGPGFAPSGSAIRVLAGNVGYVHLSRLTLGMVDWMFETFRDTRAIIFDDRGYPGGPFLAIASRLSDRADVPAATFVRPVVMGPDSDESTALTFLQRIQATEKWRYRRPTVLLINEATVSASEHTGLFLEAANHTTFIGSPTQGADGDVTTVVLPGGIAAFFTGQAVRHADGRQLQRIGLIPDILVRPTISGIRAGRDEVLERALQFIEDTSRTSR